MRQRYHWLPGPHRDPPPSKGEHMRRKLQWPTVLLVAVVATAACVAAASASKQADPVKIGLITKTETNPFFVKMRLGAQAQAKKYGAQLMTAAGKFDSDNASQVAAIENMVAAGVKGILITPDNTKAIVPAIQKARDKGVLVIALDSPTDPQDASDALFATDNFKAGLLIGKYAKSVMKGKKPIIAALDTAPGVTVGVLRHNGFLVGFGDKGTAALSDYIKDPRVVCAGDTEGDQVKGQTVMENC